ncbi:antitoxin family protein [bacterium]|nr:antitoxin family protein [bacterium]
METAIRAIYRNGVFAPTPRQKVKLKDGQAVELLIKRLPEVEDDPAFDIASLAVKTGIPDLAKERDHYLYGTPKRSKQSG